MFETNGAEVLRPLVEDGVASFVRNVDELATQLGSVAEKSIKQTSELHDV